MSRKTKSVKLSMWQTKNCRYPESIFLRLDGYSKPIAVTSNPEAPYGHRTLHKALVALLKEGEE